jgi:hypothetical protein
MQLVHRIINCISRYGGENIAVQSYVWGRIGFLNSDNKPWLTISVAVRVVVWPSAAWPSHARMLATLPLCSTKGRRALSLGLSTSLPSPRRSCPLSAARHGRCELELTSSPPLCSRCSVLPHVPLHAPPPPPSQILARAPLLAAPPPSQFAVTGAASAAGSCARG